MRQPVANLARLLFDTARLHPNRIGLSHGTDQWRWGELCARSEGLAAALAARGLTKGDRILVHSRNSPAMVEAMWAVLALGAVWVPTNNRLTPPEVAYLADASGAKLFLCDERFPDHAAALADLDQVEINGKEWQNWAISRARFEPAAVLYDDPAWFFFTSGTTGRSKAAVLTHGQMAFVVNNHLADLFPGLSLDVSALIVAPLSHAAGLHMLAHTARGVRTVLTLSESLDPAEVWRLIETERVATLFTVPTLLKRLVEHPAVDHHDKSSLSAVLYAGAPMYRADQRLAYEKLGNALVQYYGLGEVTSNITLLPGWMHAEVLAGDEAGAGPCGYPRTGMEIAILEPDGACLPTGAIGEICVRGPAVFAGYHNNPEANAKAFRGGWFHTGDLGFLDARGLLTITGRESDMYISGGSNVYPRETEELLMGHPAVLEAAVVGVPDPEWGEIGIAAIVLRTGYAASEADLSAHLEGRLARYKRPRRFVFWTELPKSGYGKIPKNLIRDKLRAEGVID